MNYINFNTLLYGEEYPIIKWVETEKIDFWVQQASNWC